MVLGGNILKKRIFIRIQFSFFGYGLRWAQFNSCGKFGYESEWPGCAAGRVQLLHEEY